MDICTLCGIYFDEPAQAVEELYENGQFLGTELYPVCPKCGTADGCEGVAPEDEETIKSEYEQFPPRETDPVEVCVRCGICFDSKDLEHWRICDEGGGYDEDTCPKCHGDDLIECEREEAETKYAPYYSAREYAYDNWRGE